MNEIDARGLACPEPVMLTRQAMQSREKRYTILVDNAAARENVTRYAEHEGYTVTVTEQDGEYRLEAEKV